MLEGLHLNRRLNKERRGGGIRYAALTVTDQPGSRDPFPRERFRRSSAASRATPAGAGTSRRAERLSRSRQAALVAGAVYLVSPIDLVPGFIPVAGQLDDAVAVLLALRLALGGLPPDRARP